MDEIYIYICLLQFTCGSSVNDFNILAKSDAGAAKSDTTCGKKEGKKVEENRYNIYIYKKEAVSTNFKIYNWSNLQSNRTSQLSIGLVHRKQEFRWWRGTAELPEPFLNSLRTKEKKTKNSLFFGAQG